MKDSQYIKLLEESISFKALIASEEKVIKLTWTDERYVGIEKLRDLLLELPAQTIRLLACS